MGILAWKPLRLSSRCTKCRFSGWSSAASSRSGGPSVRRCFALSGPLPSGPLLNLRLAEALARLGSGRPKRLESAAAVPAAALCSCSSSSERMAKDTTSVKVAPLPGDETTDSLPPSNFANSWLMKRPNLQGFAWSHMPQIQSRAEATHPVPPPTSCGACL
jgi:hypothetical protein